MPLFERIHREGGRCEWLLLPWPGDPSVSRIAELEQVLPTRLRQDIAELSPSGISEEELAALLDQVCTPEVDVLFLCDMQSYPSAAVLRLLSQRPRRPAVVGLQHGLFQSWWLYNNNFCADHLFTFGERHIQELDPSLRVRAQAAGLPKLDRLMHVPRSDAGYIAFIAQRFLPLQSLASCFEALSAHTGLPVRIWDHPQYPAQSTSDAAEVGFGSDPYTQFLANASWVLSGYSTGAVEALQLGKAVVLLPSYGLTAWSSYPAVARDASLHEVMAAKYRLEAYPTACAAFMRENFGGLRHNHTDSAWQALGRLRGVLLPLVAT